ncbi:hypothetical protein MLD38_007463 [Melastoma candidum]|uniref:Uncharacterized protein n=1 Tax=Melastoma candidum TaxID=119954 RepID=A0ACB9RQF1_9MYRT|nr:hypothetical protein MLD38_007463 [Melastoma candidum]
MDRPAAPRRTADLYSTFVVHSDDDEDDRPKRGDEPPLDDDDDSLPPLLKRLPKDFGGEGGSSFDYDHDPAAASRNEFSTMIVKPSVHRSVAKPPLAGRDPSYSDFYNNDLKKRIETFDDDDEVHAGDFSTFVVKDRVKEEKGEDVSGTVVRRTGTLGGGGFRDSSLGRAVESMKATGVSGSGLGKKGRGGGSPTSQDDGRRQISNSKVSASSMPESITNEDPTVKYELLTELGKGSYGAVYKARDKKTSELVAIKVISLCEGEEGYEEIRGEIEMLQQCNNPNVVRYLGSYQGEEYLWIVMEYCGGGSVADLMNVTEKPLEEYQIAYICREALKGLSYLHSIFKVHRDIKGGNILLTEQGEVKLGDFGVAAQLTRTMSKRNTFIGTPHWMAPEVIQENRYDGKVDVWALGVSAIEMAEGLPPRASVHPMRVLFMISIEPAPMLEDKEKWSLVFHDFIAKCLTKEPRSRPTASEMLKHKFIEKCQWSASAMLPKIEEARKIKASMEQLPAAPVMTPQFNDDYGDTIPSKPPLVDIPAASTLRKQSIPDGFGAAFEGEDGFGTVIIHDRDDKALARPSAGDANDEISTRGSLDQPVIGHNGTDFSLLRGDDSDSVVTDRSLVSGLNQAGPVTDSSMSSSGSPDPRLTKADSHAQVGGGSESSRSLLKSDTLSKKGFALQDKLWSIYAAGNTVPIPFLRATDISPIALLSDNVLGGAQKDDDGGITTEALQELFTSDGQNKKGRRQQNEMPLPPGVSKRLGSSSTLMNLAQALAYHKTCLEEMPLQDMQVAQAEQTIQNLSDMLRTILRL